MTRRRILFRTESGIGFWITPEINGDSEEMSFFCSADCSDLKWTEMKAMFMGVQNQKDFSLTSDAVQRSFHSAIKNEVHPIQYKLSLDDIHCDELYEVRHGEVTRIYGSNLIYVQVYYREQESSIVDTVQFDCPPGLTQKEVLQAIQTAKKEQPISEDEDRLSYMDDVLTRAALSLHAAWAYIPIAGVIELE